MGLFDSELDDLADALDEDEEDGGFWEEEGDDETEDFEIGDTGDAEEEGGDDS
jgi:hypothetical protein